MIKIEQNYIDLSKKCSSLSGGLVKDLTDFSVVYTPEDPWFSRIYDLKNNNLDSLVNYIKENKEVDTFIIRDDQLTSIKEGLNNFKTIYTQSLMYIKLDKLVPEVGYPEVEVINDKQRLTEWIKLAEITFGKQSVSLLKKLFTEDDTCFIAATVDKKIVGTALLYIKDGIAGIDLVGVEKQNRKSGLGSKMVLESLNLARNFGCSHMVLQASKMGKKFYETLGFIHRGELHHLKLNI